ncbi:T9SS type A sorting domain-containing protein [candidate division WOR-3 bacterium]|uniref:T9SS type A sorting domain-containing protein n=1 Tax=candidate division WOR-3 bacterium TaxID=2052148 RepID=A0A9D5K8R3_UNCW3|nr:T9SS type A sorting domain-containing protein [candidate division WOR-3 bacterium]MBD3364160.1 T9SS type A sorting domain-containing protein [candidate division WOR-3 bacterium]
MRRSWLHSTSEPIIATSSTDSFAVLTDIDLDYSTDWQGSGVPKGTEVEVWVSASNEPDALIWSDWVRFDENYETLPGRVFRYKLLVNSGLRTSVVIRDISFDLRIGVTLISTQNTGRLFEIAVDIDIVNDNPVIYDLLGRKVSTLPLNSTGYTSWQGQNDFGHRLPSGIYFLVVQTDSGVVSRKLILLP